MPPPTERPSVKLWRLPDLSGVELIRAAAITQALPKQIHDEFVVGVVERGAHAMIYRGATHAVTPGNLILAQPGETTACGPSEASGRTFRAIHLAPHVVSAVAADLLGRPWELPAFARLVTPTTYFTTWVLRVHARLEGPTTALERAAMLQNLLARLLLAYGQPAAAPAPTPDQRAVQRARDYLQAHAADEIQLEALARLVGLSAFHLNRVFHRAVGMPPHAYQINLRVARARALLAEGAPIPEVALQVGFFDQSHLTYHFRRLLGYTPGVYRDQVARERKNFQDRAGDAAL